MEQRDPHIDELISAYLDGETSPDECARVRQMLALDASHRQALEELRDIQADLRTLPGYQLDTKFADRVLQATARAVEAESHAGDAVQPPRTSGVSDDSRGSWRTWVYVAAALAAALLLALFSADKETPSPHDKTIAKSSPIEQGNLQAPPENKQPVIKPKSPGSTSQPGVSQTPKHAVVSKKVGARRKPSPALQPDSQTKHASSPPRVASQTAEEPRPTLDGQRPAASPNAASTPPKVANAQMTSPAPMENTVPSTGQLLLVMDVALTRKGQSDRGLDLALAKHGISYYASIPVSRKLEKTLLASRFFRPANDPTRRDSNQSTGPPQLVYVVGKGGQVEGIWRSFKRQRDQFAQVSIDLAFKPTELDVFRQLRQAARATLADQPPRSPTVTAMQNAAYRLVLPPTWRGMPARVFTTTAITENTRRPRPGEFDRPFAPGRLGENALVEVLFVLHPPAANGRK